MAESKPSAITLAQKFVEAMLTDSHDHGFDYNLCKAMTVVSASLTPKPRAVTRLTVTLAMCNISGTLHGGAISTLFDVCTTVALATARRKGYVSYFLSPFVFYFIPDLMLKRESLTEELAVGDGWCDKNSQHYMSFPRVPGG